MVDEGLSKIFYNRMLVALSHGARIVDFSEAMLDAIGDVPDTLLGNFWDFCIRVMGRPLRQVAMWQGRDTGYKAWPSGTTEATIDAAIAAGTTLWTKAGAWLTDYDPPVANTWDSGYDGPWIRGPITCNATGYSIVTAQYAALPAALETTFLDLCIVRNGVGYLASGTLSIAIAVPADPSHAMPSGDYTVRTIWSPTTSPSWRLQTDTITIVNGAATLNIAAAPCWVHLIVVEPTGGAEPPEVNYAPYAPVNPKCEGLTNPVGITDLTPEFSWTFSDPNPGDTQSAYQIVVGISPTVVGEFIGMTWDSAKIVSSASSNISFAGAALAYNTTYYWAVRTWDNEDVMGPPCAVQSFRTYDPTPPETEVAPVIYWPQVQGQTNPTEVNDLTPDLSWTFTDANGDLQSQYRILVASTALLLDANIGDLWTSQVVSAASTVTYAGTALAWNATYYWKVRVWDDSAVPLASSYCARQQFTTLDTATPTPSTEPGVAIREHFRLGAGGRVLEWLGTTVPSSGLRATLPADPTQPGVCVIRSLSAQEDVTGMVTRLYPQTAEGLTLTAATRPAPVGYTISLTGNYLQHEAGYQEHGAIEEWRRFDDVVMQQADSLTVHPEMAANALLDRAAEYLRTRGQSNWYYTLEVICNEEARVGETMRVVYHEYTAAGAYFSVDAELYITRVTTRIDREGLRVVGLEVATIDVASKDADTLLAETIQSARRTPRTRVV